MAAFSSLFSRRRSTTSAMTLLIVSFAAVFFFFIANDAKEHQVYIHAAPAANAALRVAEGASEKAEPQDDANLDDEIPDSIELTFNIPTKHFRDNEFNSQLEESYDLLNGMVGNMMKMLGEEMDLDEMPRSVDGSRDKNLGVESVDVIELEGSDDGGDEKPLDIMSFFESFANSFPLHSSSSSLRGGENKLKKVTAATTTDAFGSVDKDSALTDDDIFGMDEDSKSLAASSPPYGRPHTGTLSPFSAFTTPFADMMSQIFDQTSRATDAALRGPTAKTEVTETSCNVSVDISRLPKNSMVQVEVDDFGWVTVDYMNQRISTADGESEMENAAKKEKEGVQGEGKIMEDNLAVTGAVDPEIEEQQLPAWSSFSSMISRVETTRKFLLDERCDVGSEQAKATIDPIKKTVLMKFPLKGLEEKSGVFEVVETNNHSGEELKEETKKQDAVGEVSKEAPSPQDKLSIAVPVTPAVATAEERVLERQKPKGRVLPMVPFEEF